MKRLREILRTESLVVSGVQDKTMPHLVERLHPGEEKKALSRAAGAIREPQPLQHLDEEVLGVALRKPELAKEPPDHPRVPIREDGGKAGFSQQGPHVPVP